MSIINKKEADYSVQKFISASMDNLFKLFTIFYTFCREKAMEGKNKYFRKIKKEGV